MSSKRSHEGYLLVDHRNSPGVSDDLVRASGLPEVISAGEGSIYESATITCSHCQAVVVLNALRTRERGWCRKCDHYVCDTCTGHECVPFVKVVDRVLEQAVRGPMVANVCKCGHAHSSHITLLNGVGLVESCWECLNKVEAQHAFRAAELTLQGAS